MADSPGTDAEVASDESDADPEPAPDPDGEPADRLRERVEAEFDVDAFSPADMAELTVEEWEAAFDADTWITGTELLDRVEADLRSRVARREVFAVVERVDLEGEPRVLAYDDRSYALVAPDGAVTGEGAVLRDVEPVVALCSMERYAVDEPPADAGLPPPDDVPTGGGRLGHRLLLALAAVMLLAGVGLLVAPIALGVAGLLPVVAGLGFLAVGVFLGVLVANARLSDRFRAREYRDRLRAARVGAAGRPSFLPPALGGSGAEPGSEWTAEPGGPSVGEPADEAGTERADEDP